MSGAVAFLRKSDRTGLIATHMKQMESVVTQDSDLIATRLEVGDSFLFPASGMDSSI